MKKILAVLLSLVMSVSLFACAAESGDEITEATTTAPQLPKIGIISLKLDENTNKAYSGFTDALKESGYVNGENVELLHIECDKEDELVSSAEELCNSEVKVIYALGAEASKAAKSATTEIPVVFACVNDPVAEGLVEFCERPEANITGVCDYPPVFEQIELVYTIYPDVERIACIYNGADKDAIFSANLASGEAIARDIKFTHYSALTENEYEYRVDKAIEKCDAIYLTDDALSKACLAYTLKHAKSNNIPVFAESTEFVEDGCLATCVTDYTHIGYSAGELAVILMRGLKTVSKVPVEYATECTVVVNSKVMKDMKLKLPEDIAESCVFVNAK